VAQVSRSQAQVLLRGCEVVSLTEPMAHAAGQLLGRAVRRNARRPMDTLICSELSGQRIFG
jgi:hypothetical protein